MSSTHLRLEGPDLPSLLEQVRAEYGPGARDRPRRADPPRRGRRLLRPRALPPRGRGARGRGRRPGARPVGRCPPPRPPARDGPRRPAEPGGARRPPVGTPARPESLAREQPAPGPLRSVPRCRPAMGRPRRRLAAPTSTARWPAPMSTESASFADVLSRLQHSVRSPVTGCHAGCHAGCRVGLLTEAAPWRRGGAADFVRLGADPWLVPATGRRSRDAAAARGLPATGGS